MGAQQRQEQTRRRSVRVGLVAVLGMILVAAFAITAKNGLPDYLPGVERRSVSAQFDTLGALRVGDDVRIANVRSGFVDHIDAPPGRDRLWSSRSGPKSLAK